MQIVPRNRLQNQIKYMDSFPEIEGYDIFEKIGEGGMSTVWKARDIESGAIVAIKILRKEMAENEEDFKRFMLEANVMREIEEQGIVRCFDSGSCSGIWYYVMEYVDGYNFSTLLARKHHLPESDCLLICQSVAVALENAWTNYGIVHCDIKPENIMINSDGIVKLTDLGLCHIFENCDENSIAVPDQVLGTPAYISPEQIYGDVEPDCRSDIYSLAATLYHMASGHILFFRMDNEQMLRAHCDEECQANDPRCFQPSLSEGFCQMLEAMLVKNRDERIGDWNDVIDMCRNVESGGLFKPRTGQGNSSMKLNAKTYQ